MRLRHKTSNFGFMLAGITGFLFLGPLAELMFGRADSAVLMISYTGMLVISLWSLQETKQFFNVGLLLASMCVGLTVIDLITPDIDLGTYLIAALLIFQLMSIWITSKTLFSSGPITLNKLMGGICLYLLLGLTWNIFYVYLINFDLASFAGVSQQTIDEKNIYWDMTYFSFVTLTTLGYGDIQPVSRLAKVFAYAQAIVGELYIAILIGSLVGNYISQRERSKD